ncbi:hypothetical protein [Bacillus sp. JJ1562]|uniref:hypothetical protein n=1 Tax=Bacillus sp. JJ1562 TaxID=3122960 RepID=UPI00300212F3
MPKSNNNRQKKESIPDINVMRDQAIVDHFEDGIGQRVLILSPAFPFLFIGTILDVIDDLVEIDVETTQVAQLEDRIWHIHIHNIEVFFIEREDGPQIPELKDIP